MVLRGEVGVRPYNLSVFVNPQSAFRLGGRGEVLSLCLDLSERGPRLKGNEVGE